MTFPLLANPAWVIFSRAALQLGPLHPSQESVPYILLQEMLPGFPPLQLPAYVFLSAEYSLQLCLISSLIICLS